MKIAIIIAPLAIALLVLVEKVLPWGGLTGRASGAVMIAWGAFTLAVAL